jgi:ABC-type antimicrobial peptide transport system permease subunit
MLKKGSVRNCCIFQKKGYYFWDILNYFYLNIMKETSLFQNFSIDEKRKHNFKAFSFVEVIVVISMIILLVVIGAVIVSNKK